MVQFVVALSVCIGVCDADVRASASFVPPKYFYCILPVIADNNVFESVSNLAPVQKNRGHYCRVTVHVSKTQASAFDP